MVVTVVGCKYVDFKDKSSGDPIQGCKLQINRVPNMNESPYCNGLLSSDIWISKSSVFYNLCSTLSFPCQAEFVYDFDGKRCFLTDIMLL